MAYDYKSFGQCDSKADYLETPHCHQFDFQV